MNVNGDTTFEPDETFAVVLTGVTNADVRDDRGAGTIRNDDSQPQPTVRINDVRVAEGNEGTTAATFTLSLDRAPGATPVEVDWATADGTATLADNDYAAAGRRETFTGTETSRQVTVLVNGDTRFESDETFGVHLSNAAGGSIVDADGVGTITNDDPVPPGLSVSDVSVAEGNAGTSQATFTVSIDKPGPVRVHVATRDDTATVVDNDYTAAARDLTFSGNVVSQTFTVDIKGDNAFEPNEQYFVELSNAENALILDGQGIGTIVNDDPNPRPRVSIGDVSLQEGDSGTALATFTISLDRAPTGAEVRVPWATGDGTATVANHDYNQATGTETFTAGQTSKLVSVAINGDTTVEPDETFEVRLGEVTNADVADEQGVGTILNDDQPQDLQLSIGDTSLDEGNSGVTQASFTITLNAAPTSGPVTVRWATHDGSATVADHDYQPAGDIATFEVGQASRIVTVNVNGDTTIEPDESFTVELSEPTGGARIVRSPGTGTIRNDDGGTPPPAPRLSIGDTSVFEGNAGTTPATFTVTLANGPTDRDVSVDYATHDGSAATPGDYTTTADRLVFHPGEVSKTIQVPVVGDTVIEGDETFTVKLTNPSGGAEILADTGTGTIRNDDSVDPPGRSILSIGDTRVVEGNDGVTQAVFTVSLNRASGSTDPIGVDYRTEDGSAMAGDRDYTARTGHLEFTGAKTSEQVVVDVLGDTRSEPDETFTVVLSNATGADISGQGTGTIANDDQPPLPRASIGDVSVTEGNNGRTLATFTVTLDRAPTDPASLHFATANGTAIAPADYLATSGDLQFAGTTSATISVEVIGDLVGEPNETFTVSLSAPTGLTIVDGVGVGTIINDDAVRSGVFTCTATALNKLDSTANPPNLPCRDDDRRAPLVNVGLGVISIRGDGLIATTSQTPDDLRIPPAPGDNATAHAELASVKIRVLAVTIEVGMITSTAIARCVPTSDGLLPEFVGTSSIAALKVNGVAIPIGSGPIHVPLLVGSLDLNVTHRTANSVTQTAFTLNTLLGKVIIGEASAGMHATPGSPVTPNRNACGA